MDDLIREKEILKHQLMEGVSRLSAEEQRALLRLFEHRGLISKRKEPRDDERR